MTITQEELIKLKQEYETLNNKLKELAEDELKIVTGGSSLGQLDSNYQAFLEEDICAQEASVAPESQIIHPINLTPRLLDKDLVHLEPHNYRNSKILFRCKACRFLSYNLIEIQNHVMSIHGGGTDMFESINFGQ